MKIKNWEVVEANEGASYKKIGAGGYVVEITDIKDNESKEYLEVIYDIAEGELEGYYTDDFYADKPYAHRFFRSYKETALGMFKAFFQAVEASNDGFTWDGKDENQFIGKLVGIVLREEDYLANDGAVKTRLNVSAVLPADRIRKGDFKVPEKKKLPQDDVWKPESDNKTYDDVPF